MQNKKAMATREKTGRPFVTLPSNTHSPTHANIDPAKGAVIYFQIELHKLVDTVLVPTQVPFTVPVPLLQLIIDSS